MAEAPAVVALAEAVEGDGVATDHEVAGDPAALLVVPPRHRPREGAGGMAVVRGDRAQPVPLEMSLRVAVRELHGPRLPRLEHPVREPVGGHHVPVGGRDLFELAPVAVGQLPADPDDHPAGDPVLVAEHRDPGHHERVGAGIPGVEVQRVAPVGGRVLHRVQALIGVGDADRLRHSHTMR